MPRGRSISSCFDCAEPTKPTGPPNTAAGVGAPSSTSSSSRNNAVGALPMASTAPPSRSAHRSTAAADRVVPVRSASSAALVSATSDTTSLSAGSRDLRDARRHHRRIAQHRRARGQCGMGLGHDVIAEGDVLGDVDLPAGVDQPDHHARDVVGEPREVRLGANGRERLPIDLGRVADVVEHPLTLRVRCTQPVSVSGCHQDLTGGRAATRPVAADEVPVSIGRGRRAPPWRPRVRRRPNVRSRGCPCMR